MIKAEEYPEGTAERALAEFVLLWKRRKWEALAEKCQVSWKAKGWGRPHADLLRIQLAHYRLLDVRLGETKAITDVMKDIPITIDYEMGQGMAHTTLLARVICESAPFTPDAGGTWGVNPTSLVRVV